MRSRRVYLVLLFFLCSTKIATAQVPGYMLTLNEVTFLGEAAEGRHQGRINIMRPNNEDITQPIPVIGLPFLREELNLKKIFLPKNLALFAHNSYRLCLNLNYFTFRNLAFSYIKDGCFTVKGEPHSGIIKLQDKEDKTPFAEVFYVLEKLDEATEIFEALKIKWSQGNLMERDRASLKLILRDTVTKRALAIIGDSAPNTLRQSSSALPNMRLLEQTRLLDGFDIPIAIDREKHPVVEVSVDAAQCLYAFGNSCKWETKLEFVFELPCEDNRYQVMSFRNKLEVGKGQLFFSYHKP